MCLSSLQTERGGERQSEREPPWESCGQIAMSVTVRHRHCPEIETFENILHILRRLFSSERRAEAERKTMTNSEPEMELSSAQPHSFNGQVEMLQRLVLKSGPEQGDYDDVCKEAATELDKIASKLRNRKSWFISSFKHSLGKANISLTTCPLRSDRTACSALEHSLGQADRIGGAAEALAAGWPCCSEPVCGL